MGVLEAVMKITSPNPTKYPYDAHLEKQIKIPKSLKRMSRIPIYRKRKFMKSKN